MKHQTIDPHLSRKVLIKTSAVIAGQNDVIYQEPFANTRFIALREMLDKVILPTKGKTLDDFPNVKELIETGIRISSHKSVSQTSEEVRLNLKIAPKLERDEESIKKRRPLFDL